MEDLEEAGDATTPESREILLKVVQHTIFTWIIIEYYHSFSLLVLCIRAVQAVRQDSRLEGRSRHLFAHPLMAPILSVLEIANPRFPLSSLLLGLSLFYSMLSSSKAWVQCSSCFSYSASLYSSSVVMLRLSC